MYTQDIVGAIRERIISGSFSLIAFNCTNFTVAPRTIEKKKEREKKEKFSASFATNKQTSRMKKRGETIKSTAWLIKPLLHPPLHPRFQNPPKDIHSCLYSIYPIYSIRNAEFSLSLSPLAMIRFFFVLRGRREREIGILVAVWMRLMRMNHGRIDTFPFRDIVIRIDAWSNLTILLLFLPPPALLSIRESSLWAWIPDPSIPGIDQKPICDMTSGKLKLFHRWIRYIYIYISIRNSRNSKPFDRSVSKVTSFPLRIKGSFFIFSPSSLFRFFHPWKVGARDSRSRNRVVRWISRFFFRLTFFHLFSPPRFSRRVGETRLCNSCARSRLPR